MNTIFNTLFVLFLLSCTSSGEPPAQQTQSAPTVEDLPIDKSLPLEKIKLPEGFGIELFASDIENARSLCLSPNGTLFVGNRKKDKVYALQDRDGNFKADKKFVLAEDLNMPNGVAFKDGDLYVAEVNRILRFKDIENNLENPSYEVIYDKYPTDRWHGWKYIAFGPDGKLYIPVGAPCNVCDEENEVYASITRMDPDGSNVEVYAAGIRNTVGFDWHPETGELWFSDNGRDYLGDDLPPCEINRAMGRGQHFGFPYCHGGTIADPEFGVGKNCADYIAPVQNLGAHVAPLGIEFYEGENFPVEFNNQLFFAEHGSWNRSSKVGYQVSLLKLDGNEAVSYEPFATGWLEGENAWGRPVDVEVMPDGSLLVSDDYAHCIYRIAYQKG